MKFSVVYITASSSKEAQKIAEILIEEKLVACANIFPIKSIYRWKGKLCREKEVGMFVKTKTSLVKQVIKRVKELHSYEVPGVVSFSIESGYPKFLQWIRMAT